MKSLEKKKIIYLARLALHKPGTKDGQTLMVKEDGKVMCYSWCAPKMQWEAVGEVVGGTGGSNTTSGKVLFEGREYDYVFNVELDEGKKNQRESFWFG